MGIEDPTGIGLAIFDFVGDGKAIAVLEPWESPAVGLKLAF